MVRDPMVILIQLSARGVTRFSGGRWTLPHLLALDPIVPNHAENRDPARISPEKTPDCCTFHTPRKLGYTLSLFAGSLAWAQNPKQFYNGRQVG